MAPVRRFYKMSGSGNDFIFFDEGDGSTASIQNPATIKSLCARGTGVGADGVVFFERLAGDSVSIAYYNSDGSLGELCGNASLCAVRLAEFCGPKPKGELLIRTDAGQLAARLVRGLPEIDLEPVTEVTTGWSAIALEGDEVRLGYAVAGVPHVVIEVPDVKIVDVPGRGSYIRRHASLARGANVNFLSPSKDGSWSIRTYERGVEGETLACGTGAVASAVLLVEWERATSPVRLMTKSGRELVVTLRSKAGHWYPSLMGSADLVFTGDLPTQGH